MNELNISAVRSLLIRRALKIGIAEAIVKNKKYFFLSEKISKK